MGGSASHCLRLAWTTAEVTAALDVFAKVLAVSDVKSASGDWQPQLDRVVQGSAVYAVMGDWAFSYLEQTKKLRWNDGYAVTASPGSDGVYDFLSDSFTLPAGARRPDLARKWLIEWFTSSWNDFMFGAMMTSRDSWPVTIALNNVAGGQAVPFGQAMAGALLVSLPTLAIYVLLGRFFMRGLLSSTLRD
ncbi:hypothetical protein GCM10010399_89940 [Dactylosporangium fulvum]|uniref:Uncharacterized protein n=1 Tax=Dactylosporangium fulvum TaxID=53359 RepID=A0ABY5VQV8_9ACTN|nr:hypothetical protein [Dactylosporangium fulvum]UWP79474.1 hypothetical protein Dfulv_30445 [Dactylosporangium fulvum]